MAGKIDNLASRLTVLAEPMRLDILMIISKAGTCCANDILEHFDITQPTLSHHMSVLINNGLVNASKNGRFMNYSINKPAVSELKKVFEAICEGAAELQEKSEEPVRREKKKDKDKEKKKKKDKKKKK